MKLLIAGGSGFLGGHLIQSILKDGGQVTLLSRSAGEARAAWGESRPRRVVWDGKVVPSELEGESFDAVMNLSGAPIADRAWTESYKKKIIESRIESTRACVEYLKKATTTPRVFLNASAVGIYGDRGAERLTETDGPGDTFTAEVGKAWEAAAVGAPTRTVILRIGIVLGREGGAFPKMLTPFRLGLGGWFGSGAQGMPWIHVKDAVELMRFAMEREDLQGPLNLTAPKLISSKEFSRELARAVKRWALPVPSLALKLLLGKRAVLLLDSQYVEPRLALDRGYRFFFPTAREAFADLLSGR